MTDDTIRFKALLVNGCNVPDDDAGFDDNPIVKALRGIGITDWSHIPLLSRGIIETLTWRNTTDGANVPLTVVERQLLISSICCFHNTCGQHKKPIKVTTMTKEMFKKFRTVNWNPNAEIIPFGSPYFKHENDTLDRELAQWQKNLRISAKEFKEFRDEATWLPWKEGFDNKLSSYGLEHLVEHGYKPKNAELDKLQTNFLFTVFQEILQTPVAKSIVKNHNSTKDTREIWKELNDHMSKSMVGIIKTARISQYLTSADISSGTWRGTQTSFISNYKEQARQYNEMSTNPYNSGQLVQFLEQAVMKSSNLSGVRRTQEIARKAAGLTDAITFDEYVEALIEQATVQDSANRQIKAAPKSSRAAYLNEMVFDEPGTNNLLEIDAHDIEFDIDTPVETLLGLEVNQTQLGNKRSPRLGFRTWNSLPQSDKDTWDKLSDEGKKKIMEFGIYLSNKSSKSRKDSSHDNHRSVNSHEVDTDTDDVDKKDGNIEISTHQIKDKTDVEDDKDVADLLQLARVKTPEEPVSFTANIARVLSQPKKTKQVCGNHEFIYTHDDDDEDEPSNGVSFDLLDRSFLEHYSHELYFGEDDEEDEDSVNLIRFDDVEIEDDQSEIGVDLLEFEDEQEETAGDPFSITRGTQNDETLSHKDSPRNVVARMNSEENTSSPVLSSDSGSHGNMNFPFKRVSKPEPFASRLKQQHPSLFSDSSPTIEFENDDDDLGTVEFEEPFSTDLHHLEPEEDFKPRALQSEIETEDVEQDSVADIYTHPVDNTRFESLVSKIRSANINDTSIDSTVSYDIQVSDELQSGTISAATAAIFPNGIQSHTINNPNEIIGIVETNDQGTGIGNINTSLNGTEGGWTLSLTKNEKKKRKKKGTPKKSACQSVCAVMSPTSYQTSPSSSSYESSSSSHGFTNDTSYIPSDTSPDNTPAKVPAKTQQHLQQKKGIQPRLRSAVKTKKTLPSKPPAPTKQPQPKTAPRKDF